MDVGPLRRLVGALGLFALVPTAWLLAIGAVDLTTAALRAVATLVAVMVLGRLLGAVVGALAVRVEDRADQAADGSPGGSPGGLGHEGEARGGPARARRARS